MLSDEQIWNSLKAGDRRGLKTLFFRYYSDLYRYAKKFCGDQQMAEDHIQSLFLRIWERRDHLGQVKAVKTYLWTALRRSLIVSRNKKENRRRKISAKSPQDGFCVSVEELIIKGEQELLQKKKLKSAIDRLSPKQKEILYLRFYEGMSYEEIEDIMSIEYQVARNYLYKCLKTLRKILAPESEAYIFTLMYVVCSGPVILSVC